ncbi:MAG: hypothetical protein KUG77_15800 [Nannocystaceae bacterium]|nr:hypothetical protein [Nannocystaceae bacterium]
MRAFAAAVIGLELLALGCGGSSSRSAGAGSSSGGADATSSDPGTTHDEADSGLVPPGCGDNLLEDPGFEGGTPNPAWGDESLLFETPICDAGCTDDVGANPFTGSWWVWFGGVARPDTASVSQMVVIPEGNVMLRFGFSLNAGSGTGNDVFSVVLDEDSLLLQVRDTEVGSYGGWRVVELDISSHADGGEHRLVFGASIAGVGVTNFFVDDVELLLCESESSSSSTASSTISGGD